MHIIPRAQGLGPEGAGRVFCIPTVVPVKRTHGTQATLQSFVLPFSFSTYFLTQKCKLTHISVRTTEEAAAA